MHRLAAAGSAWRSPATSGPPGDPSPARLTATAACGITAIIRSSSSVGSESAVHGVSKFSSTTTAGPASNTARTRSAALPGDPSPITASAAASPDSNCPAEVTPSQRMNHRRSPNRPATRSSCSAARQIVLLPIPGAPSTATGPGGVRQPRLHQHGDLAVPADHDPAAPEAYRPRPGPAAQRAGRDSCSACSSNTSSCSGLANVPAVTPQSSTLVRNVRCRACRLGSAIDQPGRRDRHRRILIQQEHEPRQARLGRGLELQLGIRHLRLRHALASHTASRSGPRRHHSCAPVSRQ